MHGYTCVGTQLELQTIAIYTNRGLFICTCNRLLARKWLNEGQFLPTVLTNCQVIVSVTAWQPLLSVSQYRTYGIWTLAS